MDMDEILRIDSEGRIVPKRGLTPAGAILGFQDWVRRAEREALLSEIESTFPAYEKWKTNTDGVKYPLCEEYDCDGRLHELIDKLRESRIS